MLYRKFCNMSKKNFPLQRPQFSVSNARKKELDDAFFKMVYLDYEPLTKGEREGMRHFVSVAQPGYTTPCYNTVRDTLMPNALSEMESRFRELLLLGDGFALTLDIWTNRRGHSFLCVVASFVDEVFNGHTVLLSCEHHTAENIFQKYEGVLQHWNLQRRVVRVVTDSASNMIKAFNLRVWWKCRRRGGRGGRPRGRWHRGCSTFPISAKFFADYGEHDRHIYHRKQSPYAMPYPFTAARPKGCNKQPCRCGQCHHTNSKTCKSCSEEHPKHSW